MQIGVEAARAVDNKRVFVVERDDVIRAALQFMLHDEYETHEVRDLESALQKSKESRPDLIVLGGYGPQAAAEIKQALPGVKLILVLDTGGIALSPKLFPPGVDGVLPKPLRVEAVRETVENCLRRQA
jgi:DNA-binding NtrC family response regulator